MLTTKLKLMSEENGLNVNIVNDAETQTYIVSTNQQGALHLAASSPTEITFVYFFPVELC